MTLLFHRTASDLRRRAAKTLGCVCLLWLEALRSISAPVAARQPSEYEVKAAFLLNFTKFVQWPDAGLPAAGAPFRICVAGDDPFGPVLDQMVAGEEVNGRKLMVQRLRQDEPHGCQVLFMSGERKDAEIALASLEHGVLTVGEGEQFLRQGGMIAFVLERRRVRFDINQSAAAKAGLKLSSKLLSVARSVENE